MKILDILKMGVRNLLRRKTRTFLTVIGVVVGAAAIIIMISFGIAMNENLQKSIENMGDLTMIDVYEWAWRPEGGDSSNEWVQAQNTLDENLLENIKTWDEVLAVTPYLSNWNLMMKAGKKYESMWSGVTGIDPAFLQYMKISVDGGYMPKSGDNNWILFGARRARVFWDPDPKKIAKMKQKDWDEINNPDMTQPPKINILSEGIYLQNPERTWVYNPSTGEGSEKILKGKLKKFTFDKIGIIKYTQDDSKGIWDEHQYEVYVDYKVVVEMLKEFEKLTRVKAKDSRLGKFERIRIKVKDIKMSEVVQKKLMDEGILVNWGLSDMRDEMQKNQIAVQLLLGGIGAISLLVAAIGIANTMFMSIYERTKEIGVMKVLGCPLSGIQSMFLFESGIIGLFGGLVSCAISFLGSYALNNVDAVKKALGNLSGGGYYYGGGAEENAISVIPLWLVGLAIIFATIIGLISGYLPARRATKISALEAIRNE